MMAKVECEFYLVDARFFDYPWCMWGGVQTNDEKCKKCLEDEQAAEKKEAEA